jgi:hypothetical protein
VIVAERVVPEFSVNEYRISSPPAPVPPEVMVNHGAVDSATQGHTELVVEIDTLPEPPKAGK